jgi:hypothetical protein
MLGGATEPTSFIKSYLVINNQCGKFTLQRIRIFYIVTDFFIEYGIIFRISSTDNQEIKL